MQARVRQLLSPGDGPPLREIVAGAGWYPLVILTTLNVVDELDRAVLAVFGPNIKRYFDIGNTELGALVGAQVLAIIVLGVPVGYLGTKVDRDRILRWSAAIWSFFSFVTAFAVKLPLLYLTRLGSGVSKASVDPVGKSLLTDYYPPQGWNRILAIHNAANPLGGLLGPLLAAGVALFIEGDGVWRGAYVVLGVPTLFALFAARRLREPENQTIRTITGSMLTFTGAPSDLSFREATRRLLRITTFRRQMVGIGVLGFALVGLLAFFNVFLEEVHDVDEVGRGVLNTVLAVPSLLGTLIGGNVGERMFAANPRRAVTLVGVAIMAFSLIVSVAVFVPQLWLFMVIAFFGVLALATATAPLYAALSAITPPRLRPLMFSLLGLFIALFGGVFGGVLVGAISDVFDVRWGLASVAPFGVIGGLLMSRAGSTIEADMQAVEAEMTG